MTKLFIDLEKMTLSHIFINDCYINYEEPINIMKNLDNFIRT